MYILDKGTKVVMWLDPTETDGPDETKIKHEPLARKFQQSFCTLFNDVYGVGLVDSWVVFYVPAGGAARAM